MKSFPSRRRYTPLLPLLEGGESFWNVLTCLYNPRQPTRSPRFYTASTPGQVAPLKKFPHWPADLRANQFLFVVTKWPRWKWHQSSRTRQLIADKSPLLSPPRVINICARETFPSFRDSSQSSILWFASEVYTRKYRKFPLFRTPRSRFRMETSDK